MMSSLSEQNERDVDRHTFVFWGGMEVKKSQEMEEKVLFHTPSFSWASFIISAMLCETYSNIHTYTIDW